MNTKKLVEIMTGVTPPKEWRGNPVGFKSGYIVDEHDNIVAQLLSREDTAFIVRAAQNFEPLVDALMDIEAAGRPHGTDRLGNACECPQCEAWDSAKAALNNALKP